MSRLTPRSLLEKKMLKRQIPALCRSRYLQASHLESAAKFMLSVQDVKEVAVYSRNSDSSVVFVAIVPQDAYDVFLKLIEKMQREPSLRHLPIEGYRLGVLDEVWPSFKDWRLKHWPVQGDQGVDVLLMPQGWRDEADSLNTDYWSTQTCYVQNLALATPLFCFW